MDIPDNVFSLVVVMLVTMTFLAATWMRTHGRRLTAGAEQWDLESTRRMESLLAENEGLKGNVGPLEQRLAVLERIATDPVERTAREIESLR